MEMGFIAAVGVAAPDDDPAMDLLLIGDLERISTLEGDL